MASEAEVDLLISTAGALPELERDLSRIVRTAENGAPEIDVQASLAVQNSLAVMSTQLDRVIENIDRTDPTVDVEAALDSQRSLSTLRGNLDRLTRAAAAGADPISLQAGLNVPASLATLNTTLNRVVRVAETAAPDIRLEVEVDAEATERLRASLTKLGRGAASTLGTLGKISGVIGGVGLAAGAAFPLVASFGAALAQMGPAAALAAPALVTMQLAAGSLKLAMVGVSDAIETAFDPEAKPEELAKAMEKLAPNAREFVTELRSMRGFLTELQQDVQNDFFRGLAGDLETLSTNVLPDVSTALRGAGVALNEMARGAIAGANALGSNGTLGQALSSATNSLFNLKGLPNDLVIGLGSLAAAAGPAFERLTASAGRAGDRISDKLLASFKSGELEKLINEAVSALGQLARSVGNIFSGLGNIVRAFSGTGDGLFGTLEKITQAFEDLTATKGFQQAITTLSQTFNVVASTVLPLVSQALQALGPIFATLAPPIQAVVKVLGDALGKVLTALGPVLVSVAGAFGNLITALSPFITLAGDLIAALLPALIPLFNAFAQVLEVVAPFVKTLVETLSALLVPILEGIAPIVEALLVPFVELYRTVIPAVTDVLVQLQPAFVEVGNALGEVFKELGPVIAEIVKMGISIARELAPTIQPLISLILQLTTGALRGLASFLREFVVPALRVVSNFLKGDFRGAIEGANGIVRNFQIQAGKAILALRTETVQIFNRMVGEVILAAQRMAEGFQQRISQLVVKAVTEIRGLPERIRSALGNAGTILFSAGVNVVQGFINGITSRVGSLISTLNGLASTVTSTISNALDIRSPSRVTYKQGKDTAQGFINGLADSQSAVMHAVASIANTVFSQLNAVIASASLPANPQLAQINTGGPTMTLDQIATINPIKNPDPLLALFGIEAAKALTAGHNQSVVNVYLGNELVNQFINDRLRTVMNSQNRTISQGVRI